MELDKERLLKLLNMTGSEHDGEALAAIRKSNELLRQSRTNWADALGLSRPAAPPPEPTQPARATSTVRSEPRRPAAQAPYRPSPPPGYMPAREYRNSFRREPVLPRLLGFPFWILVEFLGATIPRRNLNTRGRLIAFAFALSMVLGILSWVALGYYLLFEA